MSRKIEVGDKLLVPSNKINGTPYYIYAEVLAKEEEMLKVKTEQGEFDFPVDEVVTFQKTPVWEPIVRHYGEYQ